MAAPPPVSGHRGREPPPAGGEKKKKKKKKKPPKGEGAPAPSVSVVPSAAARSIETVRAKRRAELEAAKRAWDGPHTCSTCGYDINGGGTFCTAPGCDGVAKGALQCRPCLAPVAPHATCTKFCVWRSGGGFVSPPGLG